MASIIVMDEKMKKSMECPVCLVLPRKAPVYQCHRGHCVCITCKAKLTKCPQCNAPFGNTRNFVFEEMLTKMTHACKFAHYGCVVMETLAPLELHERNCQHRLVNCPHFYCKDQVSLSKLLEHIEADHTTQTGQVPLTSGLELLEEDFTQYTSWIPRRIDLHGKQFFTECWRSAKGQWCSFVYMTGSKDECQKFTYKIRFFKEGKKKHGLTFCGPCVPLDLKKEEVVELGSCLTFTDATAKTFWANDALKYELTIEETDE